jgi:hypothetical protein
MWQRVPEFPGRHWNPWETPTCYAATNLPIVEGRQKVEMRILNIEHGLVDRPQVARRLATVSRTVRCTPTYGEE